MQESTCCLYPPVSPNDYAALKLPQVTDTYLLIIDTRNEKYKYDAVNLENSEIYISQRNNVSAIQSKVLTM